MADGAFEQVFSEQMGSKSTHCSLLDANLKLHFCPRCAQIPGRWEQADLPHGHGLLFFSASQTLSLDAFRAARARPLRSPSKASACSSAASSCPFAAACPRLWAAIVAKTCFRKKEGPFFNNKIRFCNFYTGLEFVGEKPAKGTDSDQYLLQLCGHQEKNVHAVLNSVRGQPLSIELCIDGGGI